MPGGLKNRVTDQNIYLNKFPTKSNVFTLRCGPVNVISGAQIGGVVADDLGKPN